MPTEFSLRKANQHHRPNQYWSKEKKLQVVAQWLSLGNLRLVSEVSGVSYGLIRQWRGEHWWNEFENEIRRTEGVQLQSKIGKIVNKALEEVADRLEHGEVVLNNKTGELVRKPVQMRDVHRVAADLISKREEIRKNEALIGVVQAIPVQEQLKELANMFAKMTQGKPTEILEADVVDVTVKDIDDYLEDDDAVHAEWEEGLQETDGMAEPSGSSEEEGGEQPSPEEDDRPGQGESW